VISAFPFVYAEGLVAEEISHCTLHLRAVPFQIMLELDRGNWLVFGLTVAASVVFQQSL
jgi:hypothetical protein